MALDKNRKKKSRWIRRKRRVTSVFGGLYRNLHLLFLIFIPLQVRNRLAEYIHAQLIWGGCFLTVVQYPLPFSKEKW